MSFNDWNFYFLKMASLIAKKSKDPRTKIGAVIVKDKQIISSGYNGFPKGVSDDDRLNKDNKNTFMVHAEANAIIQCAKNGTSCDKSTLYTFAPPCCECSKLIINSGIKYVKILESYYQIFSKRDDWKESVKHAIDILNESGICLESYNFTLGEEFLIKGEKFLL